MIALHRAAERRFAPWKNGGGQTAEILSMPHGAGFDDFHWRISTARIAHSGPFSAFPGVSRSLTVLEGGPVTLEFADGSRITAGADSGPAVFSGAAPCHAVVPGGPLLVLNVMVRAPYACAVWRASAAACQPHAPVARYLLACADIPPLGMARHDLAALAPDLDVPEGVTGDNGLIVDILRTQGAG
ncbi:MAG: HutD family protein [Pseudomonadota bacterium]|nr:HutD family protein [Pseudomonadota bacterium]